MSALQKKTPARLTVSTTRKLPRHILWAICVVYLIFGLFFRDAWKTDDAVGLATMLSAVNEPHSLLTTTIGEFAFAQQGPLATWIGYLFINLFSPIISIFTDPQQADILAARLPNILYFAVILLCTWYGTYLLARRPECQPLPLPFGGEPPPKDYGRMLADCAFLFILATIGITARLHETSTVPVAMASLALVFYAYVRLLDHPVQAFFILLIGLCASFFARGFISFIPALIATVVMLFYKQYPRLQKVAIVLALVLSLIIIFLWYHRVEQINPYWLESWLYWHDQAFNPNIANILSSLRDAVWFLWPVWPFTLIALWQWRQYVFAPHIFIPMVLFFSQLILIGLLDDAFEPEYVPLAVPTAILGAMAVPTLRRSFVNGLDWFSIMILSLAMIAIWVGWAAFYFGWPAQIHHNIARLVPGMSMQPHWFAIVLAVIISLLWYRLIHWRLRLKPHALWRGLILSAGGLTCGWALAVLLWQPAVDYNRSYKAVGLELSQAIRQNVPTPQCVRALNLGLGQRSLLYIYGRNHFSYNPHCQWVLVQHNTKEAPQPPLPQGKVVWSGQRTSERHGETFSLIHKKQELF